MLCQAVVYLTVAVPAVAQSQASAMTTIKPARSADPRNARVQLLPTGDLIARSVTVVRLFSYVTACRSTVRRVSPLFPTGPFVRGTISK